MVQTDILQERYPNLAFLLRFQEGEEIDFPLHGEDLDQEVGAAIKPLSLDKLEVVYVYGLGLGYYYFPFKEWLSENKERDLVFIEENLTVLKRFLEMEHAGEILSHPQVHIRFNLNKKRLNPFLEECAASYPLDKIEVIALAAYKKKFRSRFYRLRLKLRRLSTVHHAIFQEEHYYNLFFKNLLPNFQRMDLSFNGNGMEGRFEGIPAVICGAGPSLESDLKALRDLTGKGLIFAGGSAITALSNQGITPHFGVAIDPNFEEVHRFKASSAFELPLFYAARLHPKVFETFNGPHGYLHTQTGGPAELWLEDQLNLKFPPLRAGFTLEALSVTTTAIELAATLGCNPIILVGVDLAFTNNQAYTSGVVTSPGAFLKERQKETRASERLLTRKDIFGKPIHTLVKWVMESTAIATFAKKNPDIQLLNATSGGLGFEGVPNVCLSDMSFPHPRDLYGMVHQMIETHPMPVSLSEIDRRLFSLKKSLKKAAHFTELALGELERVKGKDRDPETGQIIFAQMEMETLDAYSCFLEESSRTFLPLLRRKFRPPTWKEPAPHLKWKFLHAKWTAYKNLIDWYLEFLGSA